MRRFILTAVTDSSLLPSGVSLRDRIEMLCRLGVRRIVLREKGMPLPEYEKIAEQFVDICRRNCVISVLSHHKETALRLDPDEFQLSIDEIRNDPGIVKKVRRVCVSVHSKEEAIEAQSLGASSVTAGHIFATDCKKGIPERGLDFLKDVVDSVDIPVHAIGGIDLDVIDDLYHTGASGVCLMSTMMDSSEDHISDIVRRCFDINRPVFDKGCLALYAVTDSRWLKDNETIASKVESTILGGATIIQLREKDADRDSFVKDGRMCLRVCRSYGIPLVINDDVSVASEIGADGVHLGQDDMSPDEACRTFDGFIGVSAHSVDEAMKAFDDGADYIGCGAVFPTSTKSDTGALGTDGLRKITEISQLPVVAIGGIDSSNIPLLNDIKISGVAVVSAIFSRPDIETATAEISNVISETILRQSR